MAEQKSLNLRFSGLWTSTNPFSEAPAGAFEVADNIVLRDPSLVEPRRGYSATAAIPSGQGIARMFPWNGRLIVLDAAGGVYDFSDSTSWSSAYSLAATQPDSSTPNRSAVAAKSFFLTTGAGVRVLDKLGNLFLPAGILPPPYTSAAYSTAGNTWLTAGSSAAYKVVLCRYDTNSRLVQSATSPRTTIQNGVTSTPGSYAPGALTRHAIPNQGHVDCVSSSPHGFVVGQWVTLALGGADGTVFPAGTYQVNSVTDATHFSYADSSYAGAFVDHVNGFTDTIVAAQASVAVTCALPYKEGFSGGFTFAQLYRTFSAGVGLTPSDEYFLISEHTLTAGELTAGSFTFQTDATADSFLTTPLYTNANTGTGQGENDRPPLARDVCLFGGKMLYANTTGPQTLNLQLIGTNGLSNGSTVSVAGVTFTAGAAESGTTFQLLTYGTPSQNVEATARSLCRVVNNYFLASAAPSGIRLAAYYTSGGSDVPGMMTFQEMGVGGSVFTIQAGQDGQVCWVPDLSLASFSSTSDPDRRPARLWWSPDGLPWSVPSDNWVDVGAEDQDLLRVLVVRSTVFLFKKDGLWSGQVAPDGSLNITPFDPGLILLAPESCALVGNSIHCLTNHGCVYVSEAGISHPTSGPIERDINAIQAQATQYTGTAFGVPYENEGLYLLALPMSGGDSYCSQQYVYQTKTGWTRWLIANARHGCFDPARNALAWAVGTTIWEERKSFTNVDIQDPGGASYVALLKLLPVTGGDPLHDKRIIATFWSFKIAEFQSAQIGFDTDKSATTLFVPVTTQTTYPWGSFSWGGVPWGSGVRNFIFRANPPQAAAECTTLGLTLSLNDVQAFWQLQGISLLFEPSTALVRR